MGVRGPVPKRSEERVRTSAPGTPLIITDVEAIEEQSDFDINLDPMPPMPPENQKGEWDWHPMALALYDAMARSPQAMYMTAVDWAAYHVQCEQISRELKPQVLGINPVTGEPMMGKKPMLGSTLKAHLDMLKAFGVTEEARLRMGHQVTLHKAQAKLPGARVVSLREVRMKAIGE